MYSNRLPAAQVKKPQLLPVLCLKTFKENTVLEKSVAVSEIFRASVTMAWLRQCHLYGSADDFPVTPELPMPNRGKILSRALSSFLFPA